MKELIDYSVHDIFEVILKYNSKSYTYIILGTAPKTGKTWLCTSLTNNGFKAFEISEYIHECVEYKACYNYCIIDEFCKLAVIVLNKPLDV